MESCRIALCAIMIPYAHNPWLAEKAPAAFFFRDYTKKTCEKGKVLKKFFEKIFPYFAFSTS